MRSATPVNGRTHGYRPYVPGFIKKYSITFHSTLFTFNLWQISQISHIRLIKIFLNSAICIHHSAFIPHTSDVPTDCVRLTSQECSSAPLQPTTYHLQPNLPTSPACFPAHPFRPLKRVHYTLHLEQLSLFARSPGAPIPR